jgi:hypothetical protein
MTSTRTETFRKAVDSLAGMFYRLDKGLSGGRNSGATDEWMRSRYELARETLAAACADETDGLPELLDSPRGARLAAKWNTLERRMVGLR